jgi:hypothetical protein
MIIYLYIKTHNVTGLKYLGKTSKDPFTYFGSGIYWKQHIKQYGKDIRTEILKECTSKEELSKWGRYYSDLWDVAKSSDWANKIPETGGSDFGVNHPCYGKKNDAVARSNTERRGENHPMFGKKNPELSERNKKQTGSNNPMFGKPSAMRGKKNLKLSVLNSAKIGDKNPMRKPEYQFTCEHCNKTMSKGNYIRWHGRKCKDNDL